MAANFETGKLFWKGEIKEGVSQRGFGWARMQVVLDVPVGNYSKKLVMDVTNEDVTTMAALPLGANVRVGYIVSAREWQGKWFATVEMTSVEVLDQMQNAYPAPQATDDDDLPFNK